MFEREPTLSIRLIKIIAGLTFGLFTLFSLVVFFISYSLEDEMFNQQLLQARDDLEKGKGLPSYIIEKDNLNDFNLSSKQRGLLFEFDGVKLLGEFGFEGQHYHYLDMQPGLLVMNVTDMAIVRRGMKDIVVVLVGVFAISLFLSYYIAQLVTQHALKPFTRLSQLLELDESEKQIKDVLLADINEVDVKAVAIKLEKMLAEKILLVQEQLAFNQGMSHEIRTPLQVMTHSLELLAASDPTLSQKTAFKRLIWSLDRIKRITDALLWLTSKDDFDESTDVTRCVEKVVAQCEDLLLAHNLKIDIHIEGKLFMQVPPIVAELIIHNLISNVINHALDTDNCKQLTIFINQNQLSFTNAVSMTKVPNTKGFGIGLQIIEKLAKRFEFEFFVTVTESEFTAAVKI